MNGKLQWAQPLQVVNLSEGWSLAGKPQRAQNLQVVNLSEGCSSDAALLVCLGVFGSMEGVF